MARVELMDYEKALELFEPVIGLDTFFHRLLIVGLIMAACAAAYFGAAVLLRIDELRWLGGLLKARLIRR